MARGVTRSQGSNYGSLVHPHFLLLLYPPLARASKTPISMSPPILSISQRAIIDLHSSTRPSSGPPWRACKLFSHASASALPLAGPWKLPASSPCVALFRGCSLYLFLFVGRFGRKEIRPRPNTPDSRTPLATFIAGWLMQVASVQAPIVEPSPSRTARATTSCVVRLPRHRCSVTARPWRRPVMFRFSHAYPPSGFRELRGSAARNPGPKNGFLGCCHR